MTRPTQPEEDSRGGRGDKGRAAADTTQSVGHIHTHHSYIPPIFFFFWRNFYTWRPLASLLTHSNVLAWRIPGMGEPGGLPSMESHSRARLKS